MRRKNEADGHWADSWVGHRDSRNSYSHSCRGQGDHGYSRTRHVIANSVTEGSALNCHDDRRSVNYSSNACIGPLSEGNHQLREMISVVVVGEHHQQEALAMLGANAGPENMCTVLGEAPRLDTMKVCLTTPVHLALACHTPYAGETVAFLRLLVEVLVSQVPTRIPDQDLAHALLPTHGMYGGTEDHLPECLGRARGATLWRILED